MCNHGWWTNNDDYNDLRGYNGARHTWEWESDPYNHHVRECSQGEAIPHDDTPDVETKVVCFKSSPLEDMEAGELLNQMDKVVLHDHAYASLHTCCKLQFPHLIESLPKPEPP
jgi:hypothetical protein